MILTEQEAETRLTSEGNLVNRLVEIRKCNAGRGAGARIPEKVRDLIGIVARGSDESRTDIAASFGVSRSVVSDASHGILSGRYDASKGGQLDAIESNRHKLAHDAALDSLVNSLELLKPALAGVTKAKDLSKIATDMSRVVSNLNSSNAEAAGTKVQVVLFMPNQSNERDYEAIDI